MKTTVPWCVIAVFAQIANRDFIIIGAVILLYWFIIRSHCMNAVQRCGLLLQISHMCLCNVYVCWTHLWAVQKRLNRLRCVWELYGDRLMWVQGIVYLMGVHSPPQWMTRRRCGLLPNYFGWTLVVIIIYVLFTIMVQKWHKIKTKTHKKKQFQVKWAQ